MLTIVLVLRENLIIHVPSKMDISELNIIYLQVQRRKGSTLNSGSEEKETKWPQSHVMINALLNNEVLKVVDTATQVIL